MVRDKSAHPEALLLDKAAVGGTCGRRRRRRRRRHLESTGAQRACPVKWCFLVRAEPYAYREAGWMDLQ